MNSLTRKVGIEMEGYLDSHPGRIELMYATIGQDGSLENCDWEYDDEAYGVEIRTDPLTNLADLDEMWKSMEYHGWHVDDRAGTHIHVDISDFSTSEKVKLLRFGKGIERIIFMFVEPYRYDNSYCEDISNGWRLVFRNGNRHKDIDWDSIPSNQVNNHLSSNYTIRRHRRNGGYREVLWNGKYQWMNVFGSRYPTVEYRLYHAVENLDELKMQAQMSVAICNLVKNSTLEQLEFILRELYKQPSVEALVDKFFEVLGLNFKLSIKCPRAYDYLHDKLTKTVESEAVV